jgi:pyrimidine operon attenuation protein/uracil phosphoribosyltransferase
MIVIMNEEEVRDAVVKIAKAISEDVKDMSKLFVVGIHTGGVHLAQRLQKEIAQARGVQALCGTLDITLYRDDLFDGFSKPIVGATKLPGSIEGSEVVLVDDVLYTGRTVRSALIELMDYGRPKRIRLAVLVDRGHRELPMMADYVGQCIATSRDETVQVNLRESVAERDEVLLLRRSA